MRNKILSIIVPLYNKEELIEQCLNSIAQIAYCEDLEVLVIDDGSKDSSYEKAIKYQVAYPDIFRVIHKDNGGVGSVINLGIRMASGKYVKEVDADDWVNSIALERLLSFLRNTDVDIVLNPFQTVDEKGFRRNGNWFKGIYYNKTYDFRDIIGKQPISIQRVTIKKKLLEDIRLLETRYYIDMQIIGECVLYASTYVILNDSLYYYRMEQEEQSVSLASYVKNVDSFYKQTMLSLERLEYARSNMLPDAKLAYLKKETLIYCLYLYAIYLVGFEDEFVWIEFDKYLQEENLEIYDELNAYECVKCMRDTSKDSYATRRIGFVDRWEKYARQNNKAMELYDVVHIKTEHTDKHIKQGSYKINLLYGLLDQWMMNRDQGISIENYFVKNGFSTIAIYGMGSLGSHLYAELEDSDKVRIAYAIDKKGTSLFKGLTVMLPSDALVHVDVVVVTLVAGYGEVIEMLKKKISCPIVLIEEVICES